MMVNKVVFKLIDGVEGMSLYLNDQRIAGPKPWGGGTVMKTWHTSANEILQILASADTKEETCPGG
jgi:hypothetical protein